MSKGRIVGLAGVALCALLTPVLLVPGPVTAQDLSGELLGRVVDPRDAPLAGVLVTVSGPGLQGVRRGVTDARGGFHFLRLPVGTYRVRLDRLGHRSVLLTGVQVELGRSSGLAAVTLPVEAVAIEPLQVEVARLLLDPTSASLGINLSSRLLERLPTGRDYATAIQLLPQVNESFLGDGVNVAGGTGLETAYHVEGVNVTDPYRARRGTALPYNFVRAIEVERGAYEAKHEGSLGGSVNVITHSGGDRWAVTGFGYATGGRLSANPRAVEGVEERGPASMFDVGVSLGGPLVRDRLRLFAAWNPSVRREDVLLSGLGIEEARLTRHMFAGKLDWRAAPGFDVVLTAFGDPSVERRVQPPSGSVKLQNADPILSRHREGSVTAALRGTWTPRPWFLLDASVSRHEVREDAVGATERGRAEPTYTDRSDLPRITLSGGQRDDQELRGARTALAVSGTWFTERHRVEAGVRYRDERLDLRNDESPGQIFRHSETLWEAVFLVQDVTVRSRVASAFVQDSWSVTDRVRLNVGVRWEGQYLIDQNGAVGQRITDQLQPRMGLVWQPGEEGRQKFFVHAGRYHHQIALHWATLALAGFDQRQVFFHQDPRIFPDAADSTRVLSDPSIVRGGVDGLDGQYHDELVVGGERRLGDHYKLGVSGTWRVLGASVTSAFQPDGTFTAGNPGRGALAHLPASEREYLALEVNLERRGPRLQLLGSWVLSRTNGNWPGLYAADGGGLRGGSYGPNNDQLTYFPAQAVNAHGPLPQDRTHVFKLAAAYDLASGFTVGSFLVAQSGTPLSDFGRVPSGFNTPLLLAPRGSEGRTPALWKLDLRLAWALPAAISGRVVLDFLNVGNTRTGVRFDQRRFNGARGSPFDTWERLAENQVGERSSFGAPVAFQPPFMLRLGMELGSVW